MLVIASWTRCLLVSALAVIAVQGCSIGSYGTLLTRQTRTPTAVVVDIYSVGVHIRPAQPDAGASVGYRHTSYIFPRASGDTHLSGTVWQWFGISLPATPPLVTAATVVGLETQATPHLRRLALGYIDYMLTLGPTSDESRIVEIHYDRRDPLRTYVHNEETNR